MYIHIIQYLISHGVKSNLTMKFSQLIEYNQRKIFLQKSYRKWGRETLVELYKSFQFLIFKPPSYCFEETVSLT